MTLPRLTYPVSREAVPDVVLDAGRYRLAFARSAETLEQVLRLRFAVFNLELGEGLDEAYWTQRDEDPFDATFHHLLISERSSGEAVGTYRLQTAAMAARHGYYSAGEFDLRGVPGAVLDRSVEVGRACVAKAHRNGRVLHLLWRGLAAYLEWNRASCLFGCCSLTSQDPMLGLAVQRRLEREGRMHPHVRVEPLPHTRCMPVEGAPLPEPHIPALFRSYLTLGAAAWGPPAIDREFKTIDFLVGLDTLTLDPVVRRSFFR